METNERAKELFALGFFDPARAREALGALEMMDFDGVEAVRAYVRRGAGEAAEPPEGRVIPFAEALRGRTP